MMTGNDVVSESPKLVTVALTTIELETHGAFGHIVKYPCRPVLQQYGSFQSWKKLFGRCEKFVNFTCHDECTGPSGIVLVRMYCAAPTRHWQRISRRSSVPTSSLTGGGWLPNNAPAARQSL